MAERIFGISTRLFRDTPLSREHLVHIAAHGFEAIELYASPVHFNPTDPSAVTQLAEWLSDTRLSVHSVHAAENGTPDAALAALTVAGQVPFSFLVTHRPPSNTERTLEVVTGAAAAVNVKVALEVKNRPDATPAALARLIEEELEDVDVGICFDFGAAHLLDDVGEAIETVSGHLWTTHLHDNGGRNNDHLVPYAGTIEWDAAMMELQKVGYEGALIFELGATDDPVDVLKRAAKARERLEKNLVVF